MSVAPNIVANSSNGEPDAQFQIHRAQVRSVGVTDECVGGAWGGATVKLQTFVAGKWFDVADCSWTADGYVIKELPEGRYGWLSSGGTGQNLLAQVVG